MPIKFCVLGGVFEVLGGGSADFIFMGARIFLTLIERGEKTLTPKISALLRNGPLY